MDAKKALALGLKRLRLRAGLSQAALAKKSRVSVQHLAAIEQTRKDPSFAALVAFAAVLEVPMRDLFDEKAEPRDKIADDISSLVRGLDPENQRRALTIVREVCAIGRSRRRSAT